MGEAFNASGFGVCGVAHDRIDGVAGVFVNFSFDDSRCGLAGRFVGNVDVAGALNKFGGGFKIDHPLDPSAKYLYHSFVESPDMKNVYDGVATLDRKGRAVVKLPNWFQALNRDFRYQLTAIGAPAPNLHVMKEIKGNRFVIGGGTARQKVAWQVTGIRQDAWAVHNRIPMEVRKRGQRAGHVFGAVPAWS